MYILKRRRSHPSHSRIVVLMPAIPKAVPCPENGFEDSLTFYAFPKLDARKISSSNMIELLNRESRRRTSVVGIFPNEASYIRLVTTYLMEYAEDWSISRAYIN